MFVKIGNTDITPFVQESTYDVNSYDDYEEWKDGNRHIHREQMRTYVEGSFDLVFVKQNDLKRFLDLVDENTTNDLLNVTLYVQNINKNKTCKVFKKLVGTSDRKINDTYCYKRFTLSLIER